MRRNQKSGRWFLAFLASRSNERSRGFSRPSDGLRRLALEPLEDRRLLSVGDLLQTLADPSTLPQDGSNFGRAVATDGNLAVVGAPQASLQGRSGAGGAYVFNTNTGALVAALVDPNPISGAFGSSVAISGNIVVVGVGWAVTGTSDTGAAYLFDATTGNLLRTLTDPAGIPYDVFGYSVAISGNTVAVGALGTDMGAGDAGAVYLFDATTGGLLRTLASPMSADEDFGYSVAISGDTVAVGTPWNDTGATGAGLAYVFDATIGDLLHTLANPTPAANDNFGNSVAISGNNVAVGAFQDDTGATDAGAAYLFDATTGDLVYTLANPTPAASDNFGNSVAISGNTVVVGTYEQQIGTSNAGAAYVFDAATGNLLNTLADPAPTNYDYFGSSVAIADNTVVVGAYEEQVDAIDAGAAYAFDATTGSPLHTLASPVPAAEDYFGAPVAVSSNTVVVGSPGNDTGATDAGVAYLFDTTTGNLLHTLANPTPAANDYFGGPVAISGNIVVVGSPNDDTGAYDAGAVYLFDATTGALLRKLANPSPAIGEFFGYSVAISGNVVVVGADQEDTGVNDAGATYVFDATTGSLLRTLTEPTPEVGDSFGTSVAISGNTVVVGAIGDYTGAVAAGAAYLFDVTTGSLLHTLVNPTPAPGGNFGNSVAIFDNVVVVGALQDDTGATHAGAAYVFDAATGSLLYTLANPAPTAGDNFGASVAISGNTLVVGAMNYNDGATDGAAYVFDATTGSLLNPLADPAPAAGNLFGRFVAIFGNVVVVGTPGAAGTAFERGAAYLFDVDRPPTVTNVVVSSTSWNSTFLSYLASLGSQNAGGYSIPVGSGVELLPLPWTNINQIKVTFSENVVVNNADLALSGVNVSQYDIADSTFDYDPNTCTATWTLPHAIGTDKLLLELNADGTDPIQDFSGNRLDGEWTNPTSTTQSSSSTYPSGDGTAGGDFLFRFNVLPGDADQDGTVSNNDLGQLLRYFNKPGSWAQGDFDGDGTVDNSDLGTLLANYNKTLPSGEPIAGSFLAVATVAVAANSKAPVPSPPALVQNDAPNVFHAWVAAAIPRADGLQQAAASAALMARVGDWSSPPISAAASEGFRFVVRSAAFADRARAHDVLLAGELVAPSPSAVSWLSEAASDPKSRHPARDLESLTDAVGHALAAYDDEPYGV